MRTRKNRIVLIFICVLAALIAFIAIGQSNGLLAQKNYLPSATYVGDQVLAARLMNSTAYKVNQNGERYGSAKFIDIGLLDLVLAEATNGKAGYVRATDLEEPMPASPEEAANWRRPDRTINVYAEDGKTVLGIFIIKGNAQTENP